MTRTRKITLWALGIVASPFVLVLLVGALLYMPPVQSWAVRTASRIASEETGWDIGIEKVRLRFPLDLDLRGVRALNPDTLLSVRSVWVGIDFAQALRLQLRVKAVDLREGYIDTQDLIAPTRVSGRVGVLHLEANPVDLLHQRAEVTDVSLTSSDIDIQLRDTTITDTTEESEPVDWTIGLRRVRIEDTGLAFHTPLDTLSVKAYVASLQVDSIELNLGQGLYEVAQAELKADMLAYDMNHEPYLTGLDYNHIFLTDIGLLVSDISYCTDSLSLFLADLHAQEKSGLTLTKAEASFSMAGESMEVPRLLLATTHSTLEASASLDLRALEPQGGGSLQATVSAEVGMGDVALLLPDISSMLPQAPLTLQLDAAGNVDDLSLRDLHLMIAPMLDAKASGTAGNLMDMDNMAFSLDWDIRTYDLSPVLAMAGLQGTVRLPQMALQGLTALLEGDYVADLSLSQAQGRALLRADYNTRAEAYNASLDIRDLSLSNFLILDSLMALSAKARLTGNGFDPFSPSTRLNASLNVDTLVYGAYKVGLIGMEAKLAKGQAEAQMSSDNELLRAQTDLTAQLARDTVSADMKLRVDNLDLHALGLVSKPLSTALTLSLEGGSNMRDSHQARGSLTDLEISTSDSLYKTVSLAFSCALLPDSLGFDLAAGDLEIGVNSTECLDSLLTRVGLFGDELSRQVADFEINQLALKHLLPTLAAHISMGQSNPVHNMLHAVTGYSFDSFRLDAQCDTLSGLDAQGKLLSLNTGAIQIDTVRLSAYQDSEGVVKLLTHVANNEHNRQAVFTTDLAAQVTATGLGAMLVFRDEKGRNGLELGADLQMEDEGIRLRLLPTNPIVAYRIFTLNEDNYIYLGKDGKLRADVDLLSDDGTGLMIYTTENDDAKIDATVSVNDLNIGEIMDLLPYMPDIRGLLDCDAHLVITNEKEMSVGLEASVEGLVYEDTPMGNMGAELTYLPNADGSHYVDALLTYEDEEVLTLSGTYSPDEGGCINAEAQLHRLPLALANGFIPDKMAELAGYAVADFTVKGPLSAPVVNGYLATDSLYLTSDMYSLDLRFPDDTITVHDNYLSLNRIEAYSKGANPLVLEGNVDCRDLSNIRLDVGVEAHDFQLINAPKTRQAIAYGKVFVDMRAKLTGTLDDIRLGGSLTVQGGTDVTYVLSDSPLTVDDQLADLVEFVDFNEPEQIDSLPTSAPQNLRMEMALTIEQTAQVHCLLSQDGSNYVDIEGGGDFTMTYDMLGGLNLFGRYTVVSGAMNYSIMVLSLKDCTIASGSYVEFMGNVMNPRLNVAASEKVKSTVTTDNVPRSVTFDVGVSITQTLDNMGLEFTVEAPEDMTISNELATLTAEGRSKVAVTLMVTGMYIAEDGSSSGSFNGSNALNAFLQSQISSISNKALSTVDVSFGMENTTTASGGSQTDYNFSFAKHFWGNRITLIIGGKVSSGDDVDNNGQSIIDNVSIEYRLDSSATRYVRVYYDKNTESVLEGEVTEMGAGIVLRRKSNRLGELFIFQKKQKRT